MYTFSPPFFHPRTNTLCMDMPYLRLAQLRVAQFPNCAVRTRIQLSCNYLLTIMQDNIVWNIAQLSRRKSRPPDRLVDRYTPSLAQKSKK